MENHVFWAFFVIALIAGITFGIAATNSSTISGQAFWNKIIPVKTNCSDSDGGINYYTKGICTDANGNFTDYCSNSTWLKEFYCANNTCASTWRDCGAFNLTCMNGVCVNKTTNATGCEQAGGCQNVLDMLNKCVITFAGAGTSYNTCDQSCTAINKTCTIGGFDIRCSAQGPCYLGGVRKCQDPEYGNISIYCFCCSP